MSAVGSLQNREPRSALLEESQSRYADLYHLAPVAYCIFDGEGQIVEANLRAAELFNRTRHELVGSALTSIIAPHDRKTLAEHLRSCLSRQHCEPCELTFTVPQRGPVVAQLVSTPLIGSDGVAVACKTTLHDISAYKASERRLQLVAEAGKILASSLDISVTLEAVLRLTVPLLADHARIDFLQAEMVRTFASDSEARCGSELAGLQAEVLRLGEAIYQEGRMLVPLRARGTTLGVLTLVLDGVQRRFSPADVTLAQSLAERAAMAVDNAALLEKAQAAVRARGEVLSVVSHDLKNPLHAIRLNGELALHGSGEGTQRVEAILDAVEGMQRMIGDLLDVSGIEAGLLALVRRRHALPSLVAEAAELMRPLADARRIMLRHSLRAERATLECDRDRILQVLSNLLGNAIKFTPPGGAVSLDVAVVGQEAHFSVQDSGIGIEPHQLSQIFQRFWEGKRSREHGSGLGLYIAKGIIDAHGGTIDLQSEPLVGTRVAFTLPGAAAAAGAALYQGPSQLPILVVDDCFDTREGTVALLKSCGYLAHAVADGQEALDHLRRGSERPRLILLDLRMPVMDGWRLCDELQRDASLASIPVVVLSSAPDLEEEAAALGVAGFLRKPLKMRSLFELIATAAPTVA